MVYFESDQDLEVTNVDIADILLVIAKRISQELENNQINLYPTGFKRLLQDLGKLLDIEITDITLLTGIAEIAIKTKENSSLRRQMNQYLVPKKNELIKIINKELIEPAIAQLKAQGKQGLVVIVDNLDRVDNTVKEFGKSQQEYIFIDQGEYLQKLGCHLVYTVPLGLFFSDSYGILVKRFKKYPIVLPMVKIKLRDETIYEEGMERLRQMVLGMMLILSLVSIKLLMVNLDFIDPPKSPLKRGTLSTVTPLKRGTLSTVTTLKRGTLPLVPPLLVPPLLRGVRGDQPP